jgi:hypothetical protein
MMRSNKDNIMATPNENTELTPVKRSDGFVQGYHKSTGVKPASVSPEKRKNLKGQIADMATDADPNVDAAQTKKKSRSGTAVKAKDTYGNSVVILSAPGGSNFKKFIDDVKALPKHLRTYDPATKKWNVIVSPASNELMEKYNIAQPEEETSQVVPGIRAGRVDGPTNRYTRRVGNSGQTYMFDNESDDEYDAWKDGELEGLTGVTNMNRQDYLDDRFEKYGY